MTKREFRSNEKGSPDRQARVVNILLSTYFRQFCMAGGILCFF